MITDEQRDQARAIYRAINVSDWAPEPVDTAYGVASSKDECPELYVELNHLNTWETLDAQARPLSFADPETLICMALDGAADAPDALRLYWREMGIDPMRSR